ncbi:MAG: hypothetical protein KIT69_20905, partial [Propionibacteriaceae bacterium]|nr:hypothetical protein [Propionibacteriaceae bacterium]
MSLRPTILAAAIAAAFAAGPAQALQITTSLTGTLSKDGVPYDPSPLTTTGAAPGVISLYQPTGSYPDSGFYGDLATANTIVRVVAGGISGQITSSLVYTATVTNDTAAAIDLSFDFHIGRGRVSVAGTYDQWVWDPETESGSYQPVAFSGNASLKSEIRWGDESLWSVHLEVTDSSSTAATVINDN